MSQNQRISWMKLVASASCAIALGTFMVLSPAPTQAQSEIVIEEPSGGAANCVYAGEEYSPGACRGGQRCTNGGTWSDDRTCPAS
jgi:hypothetical protein